MQLTENLYHDLDEDMEMIVPILTECDVDDDFMDGIENIGNEIPILPLRNMVLFPGIAMPVMLGRQKSLRLAKEVQGKKILIGVICQKDRETDDPGMDDCVQYRCYSRSGTRTGYAGWNYYRHFAGKKAFRVEGANPDGTLPLKGKVELLEDVMPDKKDREFEALISTIKDLTIKMLKSEGDPSRDMIFSIKNNNNVIYLINFSCTNVVSGSEKMELLLIGDLKERAYRLLFILNREYQLLELKNSIQLKTHEDINQQQKEYFLQQQIKTIQEELGGNINEQEIKALKAKAVKKKWSAEVAETFEKEVRKLERLHPQSPDFSIQTQYVQTFVNLPWNEYSKDNFNLKHAEKVLDRDHYGLEKVKERIIEHSGRIETEGRHEVAHYLSLRSSGGGKNLSG